MERRSPARYSRDFRTEMKLCSKCKTITTEFRVSDTICKPCRKEYAAANKDKATARNRKYQERQKKMRMWKVVPAVLQKKLRGYAQHYAARWGLPNLSDEYAQDLIEVAARGISRSNEQVWVELIKSQYGRFKDRRKFNAGTQWESIDDLNLATHDTQHDTIDHVTKCLNDIYPDPLSIPRLSFLLMAQFDMQQKEIADLLCIHESRVSQHLVDVRRKLKKKLTMQCD